MASSFRWHHRRGEPDERLVKAKLFYFILRYWVRAGVNTATDREDFSEIQATADLVHRLSVHNSLELRILALTTTLERFLGGPLGRVATVRKGLRSACIVYVGESCSNALFGMVGPSMHVDFGWCLSTVVGGIARHIF